ALHEPSHLRAADVEPALRRVLGMAIADDRCRQTVAVAAPGFERSGAEVAGNEPPRGVQGREFRGGVRVQVDIVEIDVQRIVEIAAELDLHRHAGRRAYARTAGPADPAGAGARTPGSAVGMGRDERSLRPGAAENRDNYQARPKVHG